MITIGDKVQFVPSFNESQALTAEERKAATVAGEVVYINYRNKYFTVQFKNGPETVKESFKFYDIGKRVHICE